MKIKSIICMLICLCVLSGCGGNTEQTAASNPVSSSTSSRRTTTSKSVSSSTSSRRIESATTESSATTTVAEAPTTSSQPQCSHIWQDATCTEPRTCILCNQTTGKALGHSYSGKYCVRCGASNPNYEETIEVYYLSLDQYSETIYIGNQISLTYSIYPDNATNKKVTWSSSDSSVATVDQSGVVTGISAGEAKITVKSENGKTADCKITVKEDIAAKSSLSVPSCPKTINYYSYSGSIYSTTRVTDISYKFEETYNGEVNLLIYFSGEKTYDSQGSGQSSSCKIGYKLYDADNYVIADGTAYTTSVKVGEKYKDKEEIIYFLKPGAYRLEILHVN